MYKRAIEYLATLNIFRATDWTETTRYNFSHRINELWNSPRIPSENTPHFPFLQSNLTEKIYPIAFSEQERFINFIALISLSLLKKKRRLSSLFRTLVLRRDTDQFLFCLERTNSPSFRGKEKNLIDAHYRATHNNNTRGTLETSSHQTFPPKKQGGWTQVTLSESEYS